MKTLTKVMAIGAGSWGTGSDTASALNRWAKEVGHHLLERKEDVTVELRVLPDKFEMDGLFNLSAERIEKLPSITLTWAERNKIWGGADYLEEKLYPATDVIYELEDCEVPN